MKNFDCEPTLTDTEVLDFCKKGFMLLESVVPEDINKLATEYADNNSGLEPIKLLETDWFVDNVILNKSSIGAVRSLLGSNLGLPHRVSNHRGDGAVPAQDWHNDGGSKYGPELNYLQVFYYPEGCVREMGPTELLPGSHFLFSPSSRMGHYGRIRGSYHADCPPGSILITVYSIWHRRSEATMDGIRNNFKYNYWRTVSPTRDWIEEPEFDYASADYTAGSFPLALRRPSRDSRDAAEMFFWLSGIHDKYEWMGGQGWPMDVNDGIEYKPYGVPKGL